MSLAFCTYLLLCIGEFTKHLSEQDSHISLSTMLDYPSVTSPYASGKSEVPNYSVLHSLLPAHKAHSYSQ